MTFNPETYIIKLEIFHEYNIINSVKNDNVMIENDFRKRETISNTINIIYLIKTQLLLIIFVTYRFYSYLSIHLY